MSSPLPLPHLLIIDSSSGDLSAMATSLKRRGYRVDVACGDGDSARRAQVTRPDLILLGVTSRATERFDACTQLKKLSNARDIPVIVLGAPVSGEVKRRAIQSGAVAYLTEPWDLDDLLLCIETHLTMRAALEETRRENAQLKTRCKELEQRLVERTAALEERGLFAGEPTVVFKSRAEEGWPIEYVSPNVFEQFGYRADELMSSATPFASAVHPDDLPKLIEEATRYLSQGLRSYEQLYRIRHADGSYRWIRDFSTVIFDANDEPEYFQGYILDITEQKRSEEELAKNRERLEELVKERTAELQESKAYLRALIDNLPFEFWAMDRSLRYTMQNAMSLANYGSVVGKRLDELGLPSEVASQWEADDRRVLAGEILHSEYEKEVDGERKSYKSVVAPVSAGGEVVGIVGIALDMTPRKRSEEARSELQRQLQIIADNLPGAICHYRMFPDGSGKMLYSSQSLMDVFGFSPQELADDITPMAYRIHPDDLGGMIEMMGKAARESRTYSTEFRISHPVKGERWILQFSTPVHEPEGTMLWYGMMFDITDRKQAECKLKEALEFNEGVINAIPDLLFEIDRNGNYLNVWTHTPDLLAAQKEMLLGNNIHTVLAPEAVAEIMAGLCEAEEKALSFGRVIRVDLPNGPRWFELSISLRHSASASDRRFLVLSRDITDRREADETIRTLNLELEQRVHDRTAQLEAANQELRESERRLAESHEELRALATLRETAREEERKYMAREIHDELGQYLTALGLCASTMDIEFGARDSRVAERIQRMVSLVEGTKQVARRLSQRLRPAALDMGIDSALDWLVTEFMANSGVPCRLELDANAMRMADGCTTTIFRVVQESLTNIARHAEASHVAISLSVTQGEWRLEVHDDGKGFDTSKKRKDSFGLVGMRERLLAVGGTLEIVSSPGQGTTILARGSERGSVAGLDSAKMVAGALE